MHSAGTGFRGDMVAEDDGDLALQETVLQELVFQRGPLAPAEHHQSGQGKARDTVLRQRLGHQQGPALPLDQDVVQRRVEADGHVGRQRPGRGGPDGQRDLARVAGAAGTVERRRIQRCKGHVDGGGLLVLVLHLGLGQGGTAVRAPVHRLEALVQVAVLDNAGQGTDDVRLEGEVHGEVGIEPVPQHAHADEIGALGIYLPGGIFPALLAKLRRAHLDPGLADLLLDIQLDRQAVAIPAGHIGRIETRQGAGLDDDVLEDLVDRMAQVQLAVGVGRAVVEDEFRAPGTGRANLLVQPHGAPLLQSLRFPLGQAGLHRKVRAGQVQCVFVITHSSIASKRHCRPSQARAFPMSLAMFSRSSSTEPNFCSARKRCLNVTSMC